MKIPKQFIYFLAITQTILIAGHFFLYRSLLLFFPSFLPHRSFVLIILLVLSVSFLSFSFLTFRSHTPHTRMGYIISALWLPTWLYLMMASVISLLVYMVSPYVGRMTAEFLFLAAIIMSIYGVSNARLIRTTLIRVTLPNLPEYWKGKKAVMVSDLHLGHVLRYGFAGRVITKINRLKPDIVFIPGDFFDGVRTNFQELANLFKSVDSRHGIYYVSGNHEQIAGMRLCEDAISHAGMNVLEDAKTEVEGLQIVGAAYHAESTESLKKLLGSLNIDKNRASILLKHVPNHLEAAVDAGISLQLSGHTHLGQVWPGRYITRRVFKGFDYGLKRINDFQIYVSSGVGTWGPPMKVFTKSEIVEIIFE